MTRILESRRRAAKSGSATSIMVFLHGYGADAADLIGLADPLGEHLPDTLFVAPDAPERCAVNPAGYQWFPIPWIDGSDPAEAEKGMSSAIADLDAYLDRVLEEEGIAAERMIVLGFSQGTMMALHVGLRRDAEFAGIIGFSGRLLRAETLQDEITARPPVLLLHGDQDDVVPPASMPEAAQALQDAGIDVFAHVMKGTAHGIAPDGLSLALAFARERLGVEGT
ncbi:alpha/beta hydrolase [Profundibacterium mesophilum]|uniref:Carboxylesterase n=1 Tax=Profundibacterium mesophilum KAUST100406-0324 TaxID=1037889 RepID=A0A921NT21_9RHOB|nr:prolyl oligopeptidase family serine peptidase [Profundibacterium mesophilum]KAF0677510.1 carboxylesterase [Profundibacterium mesophilum KAUST100406-0324]